MRAQGRVQLTPPHPRLIGNRFAPLGLGPAPTLVPTMGVEMSLCLEASRKPMPHGLFTSPMTAVFPGAHLC